MLLQSLSVCQRTVAHKSKNMKVDQCSNFEKIVLLLYRIINSSKNTSVKKMVARECSEKYCAAKFNIINLVNESRIHVVIMFNKNAIFFVLHVYLDLFISHFFVEIIVLKLGICVFWYYIIVVVFQGTHLSLFRPSTSDLMIKQLNQKHTLQCVNAKFQENNFI